MKRPKSECGKRGYRDKKEALAVAHARLGSKFEPAEYLRVYQCDYCHGKWHLTSQPSRVAAVAGGEGR